MAVQNIELIHACGHSKMRAKPRTEGIHALVLSSAARTLCSRCIDEHETRRTRMIADSISRAREAARLTKLKGSPKQITWAESIRERWLFKVEPNIPTSSIKPSLDKANGCSPGQPDRARNVQQAITNVLAARLALIEAMLERNDAQWWINFREDIARWINREMEKAIVFEFSEISNSTCDDARTT
jgi:hypothetical protein